MVLVQDRGETLAFIADLIPTTAHLPLPWIMGYDLEPLRTLESKRAFLAEAEREGWRIVFEHDPSTAAGTLGREGKDVVLGIWSRPHRQRCRKCRPERSEGGMTQAIR